MSGKKEYSNGEITVIWQPELCIHSGKCVKGLPEVFKPKERPWIQLDSTSTENIAETVKACPSGALSYRMENKEKDADTRPGNIPKIEIVENGPLIIRGPLEIDGAYGNKTIDRPSTALCRCGASANKPFCDGSHKKSDFSAHS